MMVGIFPGGKCLLRISGGGDNIVVTAVTPLLGSELTGIINKPGQLILHISWGHFGIHFVALVIFININLEYLCIFEVFS